MPLYPGPGLAKLIHCNEQKMFFQSESIVATNTSIAYQLERPRDAYPWGFAVQVTFSGSPGTFSVGIQFSETDSDASYVTVGTIAAVNASNVGRYDAPGGSVFPKFVRLIYTTFPNAVTSTAVLTR